MASDVCCPVLSSLSDDLDIVLVIFGRMQHEGGYAMSMVGICLLMKARSFGVRKIKEEEEANTLGANHVAC